MSSRADRSTGQVWEARIAVEIRNPEPAVDSLDDDEDLPESARSNRLYEALLQRQASSDGPWPTQISRSDDGYTEIAFLVEAEDRLAALRRAPALAAEALEEAAIDPGPMTITVTAVDGADESDAEHGSDEDDQPAVSGVAARAVQPDERYAAGWFVDDALAQGALKQAAIEALAELDAALHEGHHGVPAGETEFVQDYLPAGFSHAYDEIFLERFRACLTVVGYKLAQNPPIAPGCVAEELALEVLRRVAADLLLEAEAHERHVGALGGVFEVCQDDDVLDLYSMREPADAAVHGHEEVSRQLGKVDMRVEAWFEPLWGGEGGATPHPLCW